MDMNLFPSVKESNARFKKITYILGGFGLILPFLLPESNLLADNYTLQAIGSLIPSAHKFAIVAQFPNIVFAYIVIMLAAAFFLGFGNFLLLKSCREYLHFSLSKNTPGNRWNLWLKALLGFFVCTSLLAFYYIFPGQPTDDSGGSRGQLIVSLVLMTKPGLAIFGSIASIAAAFIWFAVPLTIYNFFAIPFINFSKDINKDLP